MQFSRQRPSSHVHLTTRQTVHERERDHAGAGTDTKLGTDPSDRYVRRQDETANPDRRERNAGDLWRRRDDAGKRGSGMVQGVPNNEDRDTMSPTQLEPTLPRRIDRNASFARWDGLVRQASQPTRRVEPARRK